jgi:hypothetical protein
MAGRYARQCHQGLSIESQPDGKPFPAIVR